MATRITFLLVILATCILVIAQCQYIHDYGEPCDDNVHQCNRFKHLICLDRVCNCTSPETMTHNETSGTCAVKLFKPCYQEEFYSRNNLAPNSAFGVVGSQVVKFSRKLPCVSTAICSIDNLIPWCVCPNPMDAGTNGTCTMATPKENDVGLQPEFLTNLRKLSWRSLSCDYTGFNDCPRGLGLACIEGKCQCRIKSQQHFNGTMCLSRVNGPCGIIPSGTESGDVLECTQFADCVPIDEDKKPSACQCQTGFIADPHGICLSEYNTSCNEREQQCRKDSLLLCVNGKCQCEAIVQTYDTVTKQCRGLVGALCVQSNSATSSNAANRYSYKYSSSKSQYSNESPNFCIENAFCDGEIMSEGKMQGVCKCSHGYSATVNRTCV